MNRHTRGVRCQLAAQVIVATTLVGAPGMAAAQKGQLEEVIVTANKRSESLQDVSMTVVAFNEQKIREANIFNAEDVAIISPSLSINSNNNPFTSAIRIRGVGTAQSDSALEPSVGIFVDEVYLPRSGLGMADLTDIETIEVLHGPQGTLYGRNTNAGAINIRTKQPNMDEFEGYVDASLGEYNLQRYVGAVSGPIADGLAFRLSGTVHQRDGFMENEGTGGDLNDADDWNIQGKLLWEPADNLSILLNGTYLERDTTCCSPDSTQRPSVNAQLIAEGFPPDKNDPFDMVGAVDIPTVFTNDTTALSAVINYELDAGTLTSITAWTEYENTSSYDIDRTQLDVMRYLDAYGDGDTFSQELRFSGTASDDIDYLVGLFFFQQNTTAGDGEPFVILGEDFITQGDLGPPLVPGLPTIGLIGQPGDSLRSNNILETESIAAFGQATWQLTAQWAVTGGLRWTDETKDASLFTEINSTALFAPGFLGTVSTPIDADLSRSDSDVTWLLSTSYDLDDDNMLYATVSTGSKSGGFNTVNGPPDTREFDAESTTNYEVGIKSLSLDSRLQINGALFLMEIDDYQFQQQFATGVGTFVSNEGAVQTSGADLDIQAAVLPNLTLGAGVLWMNEYDITEGPNAGEDLAFVAEWNYNLSATFGLPLFDGNAYLRTDYSYMDDHLTFARSNPRPQDIQDREILNAKLGWRDANWDLSVWGRNITDEQYAQLTANTFVISGVDAYFLIPPSTWGVTARYQF